MQTNSPLLVRFAAPLALAVFAAAACEQIEVTTAPVERIEVSPPSASIQVDGTTRFAASLLSSNGAQLSGVPVTWSSLDPEIAEVDDTGLVRGLAAGSARIQASSQGASALATVTVTAPRPNMVVTPSSVSFAAVLGGADPSSAAVQITASGEGQLTGLSAQVSYANGQPTGWLSASLGSSSAPATLTVGASVGALSVGSFAATVRLSASTAANSPIDVPVTLVIALPPLPPATPSNVTTTAESSSSITVSWDEPGGQTSYRVRMRVGTSGSWDDPVEVAGAAAYYTFTNLARNRTYQFQVAACNAAGCSAYSSPVTERTLR